MNARSKPTSTARSSRTSRSVWEDNGLKYNPEAPSVLRAARNEKLKRRALYTVAFGVIPLLLLGFASTWAQATSAEEPVDLTAASEAANFSGGKAEAFRSLQEWMNSTPSPLPDGRIISWDGFTAELPPAPDPNDPSETVYNFTLETHSFTVQRGSAMWRAQVEVAVDDVIGASATASPALAPIPRRENVASTDWFGLTPASPTASVTQATEAWAAAYTGGDPDALHQIIQDRDSERSYVPLTGVQELLSVETTNSATLPAVEGEAVDTSRMIVRVALRFWWNGGKPVLAENEREEEPAPVTYDLLIEHADTATPIVVAWGAPGSGPDLAPYQNAVDVILSDQEKGGDVDEEHDDAPSDDGAPASPPTPDAPAEPETETETEGWDF